MTQSADLQQLIADGINASENENAAKLQQMWQDAKAAGITVGSGLDVPELNPDGSYVDAEANKPAPDEDQEPTKPAKN